MKTKNSDNFFAFTKRSIKKKISLIISVFLLFMCIPLQNVFADTTMVKNTFLINNGDYRTENYSIVTITLDISNCQYIQLSNDGVNYSPQQPYTTSTSWNLSNSYGGNSSLGTKTVYLKATEKDTSNTQIYQSSIVYGNMTNHLFELYNTLGTGNQINYVDAQFHVFFTNCNYIQLSNDGVNYSPKQNYHEGASYQTFNWDITNSLYGGSDSIGYKTVFMKATGLVPEDTEVYQTTLIYTHNQGWIVPKVNNLSSDGLVWDNLTTGWHSTGTTATINVDTDGAWLIWTSTYPGIPHYVPIIDKQAILTFESAGTAFYPRIYIDDITRTEGIHYDYIGTTPIPVVKGSTTIKYQDENGTDLETPTVNSNLDMNTYSYNAKSFTGYTTTDTTKAVTLTALDADQTIIFNYISIPVIKGSATIKYQDENGTDLEAPTVNSNLSLGIYSYNAKSFTGYTTTDTTKAVTLTALDADQTIIFNYISIPVIKGSITIKYQDENGTDLEAPTVNSNLSLGIYSYNAKSFTGYATTGDTTRVVILTALDADQTIIFNYISIPVIKGSTTIKYQDENGTDLEAPTVNSNLDMNTYSYKAKSFTGYTTGDTTKSVTLTALDADQTIIFNYISIPVIKGSTTIKYQDENGTDLEAPTVNSNLDMNTYSYKAKSFTGYTITGDTTKSVTLTIIDKDRIVIFKYKKNLTLVSLKLPQTGSSIDFMSLCLLGILFIIIGSFFSLLKPKKSNK